MGRAVACVGLGVVEAAAHAEEHQRNAEQDCQGDQQLGKGHASKAVVKMLAMDGH